MNPNFLHLFRGHLRANRKTKEIEVYNEYGVKMRLQATEEELAEVERELGEAI